MKSYIVALCVVCAMLFPSLGNTSQPGDMYLRFLEGDVQVKTEDTAEWLPASINMPLLDGDQIWVPENGRAELMFRDGAIVRLDRNSHLEIFTLEEKRLQCYLGTGRAYMNTRLKTGDSVVFETPTVSFRAQGQSVFGIDVHENEDSVASVFQGVIYADRGTGQMKINAGDKMFFYKYAEYPQLAGIALMDQWEQWNKGRDLELSGSQSGLAAAYLPDELGAYSSDFERNGKWVYEQEYGYVWTPTVIIDRDWSPYKVGRWVWMRGDYVWISYEPWGWAPYHYGRWAFVNHRGWCWVPPAKGDVYWGPGFVGWVYTPTYISWVPLAPREIYYGHGNYGPYSSNIRTVNINTNIIYRNIHVNNAVTTLHRDTFVTGRPINTAAKENLFIKGKRVMGAPDIRPERSSFMPVVKQIPQASRPPQQIVNRASDEKRRNNRLDHIQTQGNLPAGPTGNITRTGQAIDRKFEAPQTSNKTAPRVEQIPAVKNRTIIADPQELNRKRAIRRPGALPQQVAPIRSTPALEKKIEAPEKKIEVQGKIPQISAKEQPVRADKILPQIPNPSENVRSLPPLRSNSPAIAVQAQRVAPIRSTPALEKKIEVLKKIPEGPVNELKTRPDVRQQQNQKPIENVKIAPPVRSNIQTIMSQPQASPQPQNTEKVHAAPKGEQTPQQKATIENIKPALNANDPRKEDRIETQQRGR